MALPHRDLDAARPGVSRLRPEDGEAEAGEDGEERRSDLERRSKGDMVECVKEDICGKVGVDIIYYGMTHIGGHQAVRWLPLPPRPRAPGGPPASGGPVVAAAALASCTALDDAPPAPSSFDFLALKRELEQQEEAVVAVDAKVGGGYDVLNEEDGEREAKRIGSGERRTRRQMARQSGLLAKQVISVSSARSLVVTEGWSRISFVLAVRDDLIEDERNLYDDHG